MKMVAVIAGSGLGLFDSSLSNLGNGRHGAPTSVGTTSDSLYINAATGNLIVTRADQLLAGRGADNQIVRTYNSQGLLNDDNQDNSRFGFSQTLKSLSGLAPVDNQTTIVRTAGDGSQTQMTWNAALGLYASADGPAARDTLRFDTVTSQWIWTEGSSGQQEFYDQTGRLVGKQARDGQRTQFVYGHANRSDLVTEIIDPTSNQRLIK